jgi:hypothetical protein
MMPMLPRSQKIHATLYDPTAGELQPVRIVRAGLHFGGGDPMVRIREVLARSGVEDPEELRERYRVPTRPLLVRVVPSGRWGARPGASTDATVLRHALLLGLCSTCQYDPGRPVLWTRACLDRRIELHDTRGFYA